MSRKLLTLSATATLMGSSTLADVPNVAADIAPVHSLVSRVMDGISTPNLIVQPGASPHEYSLRPSEAAALQNADLVFWIGEDLTPWLEDALDTLADDADVTELLSIDGTILLDFREGALFEDHDDHSHDEEHVDEHAEDDDHDAHSDHDDHADHDEHDGHAHGDHDPHAWLSPANATLWLDAIAAQLSSADPENAGSYFANAAAAKTELAALTSEVNATLDSVRGGSFIVFHDAYQYFENDFDVPASGAISFGDASDPSPARIAEIQGRISEESIDCVLAEPQFNPGIVATVLDGTTANTGVIDPMGSTLEPGKTLYPQLIKNMAETLYNCVK